MEYRILGKTGLRVSAVGFGCGAVGGILVKGERHEMVQAVSRAIELGITYFDTAAIYGDGQSETNLGWVLDELGADVIIGTKVRLLPNQLDTLEQAVIQSVEQSLRRLNQECVDLIQLHNLVGFTRHDARQVVSVEDVAAVMEVFAKLRDQGKVRYWGFNGIGDPAAIAQVLAGNVATVQSCVNLLNPTAAIPAPAGFPFEDYGQVLAKAAAHQVGVIAIRVLAGGALSGSADRHAYAAQLVDPIASSKSFVEDVALSRHFDFLVEEGYAGSLVEAAIRFVAGNRGVATTLIGISTLDQLEQAVAAAGKGPLPAEALARLDTVWAGLGQ